MGTSPITVGDLPPGSHLQFLLIGLILRLQGVVYLLQHLVALATLHLQGQKQGWEYGGRKVTWRTGGRDLTWMVKTSSSLRDFFLGRGDSETGEAGRAEIREILCISIYSAPLPPGTTPSPWHHPHGPPPTPLRPPLFPLVFSSFFRKFSSSVLRSLPGQAQTRTSKQRRPRRKPLQKTRPPHQGKLEGAGRHGVYARTARVGALRQRHRRGA